MKAGLPLARRKPLPWTGTLRLVALACALGAERAGGGPGNPGKPGKPVVLVNFAAEFDLSAVGTSGGRVALVSGPSGPALPVTTGHTASWPGVTLKAKTGKWDLSRRTYLSVAVHNVDARPLRVHCRVDNAGADGIKNCVTASVSIQPGQRSAILVLLAPRLLEEGQVEFIGMRGDPPVTSKLDPARVTELVVFLARPHEDHIFETERGKVGGWREPPAPVAADDFFPHQQWHIEY